MRIRGIEIKNPFVQAPMAGVTDSPFRTVAREFHDGLLFTEMISAEALCRGNWRTEKYLHGIEEQHPLGVQLVGHDPERMAMAAAIARDMGADMIDINAGCPQLKITRTGGGSALLKNPRLLERIIRQVKGAVDIPVSVKMRLGWEENTAREIALICESAGSDFITIHGRTRAQGFRGKSDPDALKEIVRSLEIPVLANGDCLTEADAVELLKHTGAEGVMIGRATRGRPDFPATAQSLLSCGEYSRMDTTVLEKIVMGHARLEQDVYGQRAGILRMRKHLDWYLRAAGMKPDAKAIYTMTTVEELEVLVYSALQNNISR